MDKKRYKHKRGPKKKHYKKRKPKGYIKPCRMPKKYHIITTSLGKQLQDIYSSQFEEYAYQHFTKFIKESNEKVIFPVRWLRTKDCNTFVPADYKLMIIKKKDLGEDEVRQFRDEYGKFVDYEASNKEWIIIEIGSYDVEEKFWVYGYNPKNDRKDFMFIFDKFIACTANDKLQFKNVVVYKNKVLIDSVTETNMVICKNHSDAIRMYNMLDELCTKKKYKFIIFGGDETSTIHTRDWVDKIIELTGWSYDKIRRNSTRP